MHLKQKNRKTIRAINEYVDYVKFLESTMNVIPVVPSFKPAKTFNTHLIAFYLPQFYPIPLNDAFHGKGFTEWYNVAKILPQYTGHYQPHLPIDVGFYDLSHDDVMKRQIELAKQFGIYGFCSYYYWFSGKKLLEKPFENFLKNADLDFPFCFCWVLENWCRKWDTGNNEVMIKMEFNANEADLFFKDVLPFMKDDRWIKIGDKSLLLFYKLHKYPKDEVRKFVNRLRVLAKENNLNDLYIISCRTSDMFETGIYNSNPKDWDFDAWVDFPPHNLRSNANHAHNVPIKEIKGYVNPKLKATIYDMKKYIQNETYKNISSPYTLFQAVFPSWDNSSRCAETGCSIFEETSPALYKKWLTYCIKWTQKNHGKDKQIVFINAWNEWAEGAHLEPDRKNGYAYLIATREALEECSD